MHSIFNATNNKATIALINKITAEYKCCEQK